MHPTNFFRLGMHIMRMDIISIIHIQYTVTLTTPPKSVHHIRSYMSYPFHGFLDLPGLDERSPSHGILHLQYARVHSVHGEATPRAISSRPRSHCRQGRHSQYPAQMRRRTPQSAGPGESSTSSQQQSYLLTFQQTITIHDELLIQLQRNS